MWKRLARPTMMIVVGGLLVSAPVAGQVDWERGDQGWCEGRGWGGDADRYCEVLSTRVASPGRLVIDGGRNGGVEVFGGSGSQVEIRAKVGANARSESRAEEIARAVQVHVDGGRIWAEGPDTGRRESWWVSFEVEVPHDIDLDIETNNGGVTVEDVSGEIRFDAQNGGVHLTGVGGDVRGRTRNGGLHIELDGNRWAGAGLDAETTNGGVELIVPRGYSADLETGTVNGGIDIDFPVTVSGRIGRRLNTTLGDGGPPIRVVTTNGGVKIRSR